MIICYKMLSITYNLSMYLQNKEIDLSRAMQQVNTLLQKIREIRFNADKEFPVIFKAATKISERIRPEPSTPRNVGTQKYRANCPATSPEEYYRRNIFIPYLDELTSSLHDRFLSNRDKITALQCVIPHYAVNSTFNDIKPAVEFYIDDLPTKNLTILRSEWDIWKSYCTKLDFELPRNSIEAMKIMNNMLYPNLYMLLKILSVLPVSTATVKRSFSTLKRLKDHLRN